MSAERALCLQWAAGGVQSGMDARDIYDIYIHLYIYMQGGRPEGPAFCFLNDYIYIYIYNVYTSRRRVQAYRAMIMMLIYTCMSSRRRVQVVHARRRPVPVLLPQGDDVTATNPPWNRHVTAVRRLPQGHADLAMASLVQR